MTSKIDIRSINRNKLAKKLAYGDQVAIRRRLLDKGVEVSDRLIRYALTSGGPLGKKSARVLTETIEYLNEREKEFTVEASSEFAEEITE